MRRFPSGVVDQYIYFVAVDSVDFNTRKTGLSSFTVYRARNGGSATAYTTPTIAEISSGNMPGVYSLLLDEDMTIDSGDDSQEVVLHITATGMAPVTLIYELYRPKVTAGETLTVSSGSGNAAVQSIASNAITAAAIATDAIDADALKTDAVAEIVVAVWAYELAANGYNGSTDAAADWLADADVQAAAAKNQAVLKLGTADSGSTTTLVDDALTEADDDYWKGALLRFTSGNIAGQCRIITGFDAASDTITFYPPTTEAVSNQNYVISPFADPLDLPAESTYSTRELLRGFAAALLGTAAGLSGPEATFRDLADSKDRITADVDGASRDVTALDLS